MAASSLRRHIGTQAISASQSLESFQRVWLGSRLSRPFPRRLGLAVSGGADSMALAYLSKQWERSRPNDISVTAFVVDHKAREESTREANMVSQWLRDIGIKSEILELTWPESTKSPSKVTAFETHARRLRFQALGKACRDRQIEALLMGHHQDDTVETTLWRLCTGAKGAGLAGIPQVTRIPECHGIYGVSESGSSYTIPSGPHQSRNDTTISTGGILICRPLLSFPKSSLLATCHEHNIPYVSDPTNFDPTLTPRNAIRSLLAENKLPKALQGPSILSLINSSQSLLQNSTSLSNTLLTSCKINDLNLPAGTITLTFPSAPIDPASFLNTVTNNTNTKAKDNDKANQRIHQIKCLTLRRITDLLAPFPENHFPLRSFESFTDLVFPPQDQPDPKRRKPFTLGGVMFQPVNTACTEADQRVEGGNTWLLSRQPFMRNRLPTLRVAVPISGFSAGDTSWRLWDNRFWFRFGIVPEQGSRGAEVEATQDTSKGEVISLLVRPFQPSDLQVIRRVADERGGRSEKKKRKMNPALVGLLDRLGQEAPGHTRFTLPMVVVEKGSGGLEYDLPVGLPTLDLWFHGMWESLQIPGRLRWDWMYKMMDNEPVKLMGWL
ncbi:PP-loop family protein [Aspergillus bombycis]|uniref:tRNA(Ile)-lysidine synthetase n=1 Tax=Aspergillus bombycis TaxID=109264 RepID=A0A1F7ZWP0_9EURO|nr:PP-loop family protein [Aspergillus bombycis]OGM43468.1 PP-loop family protein [Aspergillus bombycis]